jgi:predicted amidophosphoribosyltransferase
VCHAALVPAGDGPKTDPRTAIEGVACPVCGTVCTVGGSFCRQCGASLPRASQPAAAPRRFCSQCGAPSQGGTRFCSACGHQFPV